MIQILPLREEEVLNKLQKKERSKAGLAFCLYEGKKRSGYLLYDINGEEGIIDVVRATDEASFDGLVRAVFNSLFNLKINRAVFSKKVDAGLLEKLSFVLPNERETPSIEGILYRCKHCRDDF